MTLLWTKTLYKSQKHAAFTDLISFDDKLFCSFRVARDHMSQDGQIRVCCLDRASNVLFSTQLAMRHYDLRDPKLSIMPDGKLLMNAYARCYDKSGKWTHSRSLCWFSDNGKSWSSPHWFGEHNWWIWRLTWQNSNALGIAYNRHQQALNLYQGNPLRSFHCTDRSILGLASHDLGYPNETDICTDVNGTIYAIARRDADSFTAQFGTSSPPYKKWQWHDLGCYIGGPAMIALDDSKYLISGRIWTKKRFKTALMEFDLATKRLKLLLMLPSGGDTSYPGMVKEAEHLWISYYSSHIDNTSAIYLSKVLLPT